MAQQPHEAPRHAPADQSISFPPGFLWGVATASYQYEGGNTNNQWYDWEQRGHIKTGDTCGLACDWWGEQAEHDFDRAQRMGLNALRVSLEWSRIEPQPGQWNTQAISRYRQMLIGLRSRGIEPLVTLHHFTHPIWFEKRGAFRSPDAVEHFTRYVTHAVEALGDLCDFWCTINEPNIYSTFGYELGDFPPGLKGDAIGAVRVQATMARAHAAAYHAIHRLQPLARVGWAQHYNVFDPANPNSPLDRLVAGIQDAAFNDFFTRAIHTGEAVFPFNLFAGDLRGVRGTCDYVGINVYYRALVSFDLRYPFELFGHNYARPGSPQGDQPIGTPFTEVSPFSISRVASRVAALGKPIYVTENGVADAADHIRPWLLVEAARTMHDVISAGVDLRGYFHWSLVDNFEWAEGWRLHFGFFHLDPQTQVRTPRPSAALYAAIAQANGLTPDIIATVAGSSGSLQVKAAS
ncbi:MAG: glycoside hydrolase family 1 protein [Ktedonobacterales bacterium]